MPKRCVLVLSTILGLVSWTAATHGADPDPKVKKIFDNLMAAIKAGDRDMFLTDATDAVKDGTTPKIMETFSKILAARMKQGYTATYLCELKQAGHQVHLWKLTFKDGGDDLVVRVTLKDGKVGGFFLQ